ncbi:TPA: excinuclease ABC subunit C [Candidatus Saccharibacteria bacterium]|nr:excinuclease ABC subunit C [Candidatus Saccharibacteria bacterium]|tara:strand:+ start:3470 stop:5029 length:1560 start_codon:yes stop_codon:yes gene_type:complete
MNKALEEKLKTLPRSAGVYFHKSKTGEIIYVGKAAVLKNRVRQYFQSTRDMDVKTRALVEEIYDTDWVETESELDALFLESEMVKRYMPRFNILLRDDKSQMFVRIDMKSEWPTVGFTRNPTDDGAQYFGPYYNGFAIKKALRYLRRVFPYYTKAPQEGRRPDLDAHIGLSPRPGVSSAEYKATLRQLIRYIEGGRKAIIRDIEKHMNQAAKLHDFENAAHFRNQLSDLRALQQKIMFGDREFLDISKDKALGDLVELFGLPKIPARIEGYDISHMGGRNVVASMVVFTNGVSDRVNYRKFKTSERNDDYANMREVLVRRFSEKNIKSWGMPDLLLIDGGKGQLEAAIQALKERSITVPVISIAKRDEEVIVHPEHSDVGMTFIEQLRVGRGDPSVAVTRSGQFYTVNLHAGQANASGHSKNLRASTDGPAKYVHVTKLFQRIRDESHRFAVSYHTVLKRGKQTSSVLEDIPGIGPATRRKLIRKFGSVRGLRDASIEDISEIIGLAKARVVVRALTEP